MDENEVLENQVAEELPGSDVDQVPEAQAQGEADVAKAPQETADVARAADTEEVTERTAGDGRGRMRMRIQQLGAHRPQRYRKPAPQHEAAKRARELAKEAEQK